MRRPKPFTCDDPWQMVLPGMDDLSAEPPAPPERPQPPGGFGVGFGAGGNAGVGAGVPPLAPGPVGTVGAVGAGGDSTNAVSGVSGTAPAHGHPGLAPRSAAGAAAGAPMGAAARACEPCVPVYAHPRAKREIVLGEVRVAYEFARARRRSIGMTVGPEGLSVRAPKWVSLTEIEAALVEKSAWIRAKLVEQRERVRRQEASRTRWGDGATFPFLGDTVIVVLDARVDGACLRTDEHTLPGVSRHTLHVGLPQGADAAQVRDVVQSWLQRQALRIFRERCDHFAVRLGVRMTRLSLSNAQTRWGSAAADGSIRLNWRLVHFSMSTIDYVVAHELAHLREMNHSARFWDVVRSVIPDPQRERGRLKDEHLPSFD